MSTPWGAFESIKQDCRWFRGDIPCGPHKQYGVHCVDENGAACPHYDPIASRILIIKLGALGDVIRTTPLLHRIEREYPNAQLWWLTHSPEVVPRTVDSVLTFTPPSVALLTATRFSLIVNLDKDREACALMATLVGERKMGFTLRNGIPAPIDDNAVHKYMTGVFDDLSKANTKSYPQEIFEICGWQFDGEEYILDVPDSTVDDRKLPKHKPVVGLNTGCGGRWTSRLWAEKNWVSLARRLKKSGYAPLLLGGEQEHQRNKRIAAKSGALYLGHFPLPQFIGLVGKCDLVITAVTMALHIAIGLKKQVVLFNNIFNRNEFELYGRGEILEPEFECPCYYTPVCPNNCMQYIHVDRVFAAVTRLLPA